MNLNKPLTAADFGLSVEEFNEIVTSDFKSELTPREDEELFPPTGPTVEFLTNPF